MRAPQCYYTRVSAHLLSASAVQLVINVKQSDALQISRIWGFYYKHKKRADRTKPLVVPIKDSVIQTWHFSCRCFFFSSFFFAWQIFSVAVVAPLPPCTCARLQPQGITSLGRGETPCCPISAPLSQPSIWPDVSDGILAQYLFTSSRRDREYCLDCPQQKALWCPFPAGAVALGCYRRSFHEFHGKTPAYQHYLFIPVSIPSIP